MVDAAVPEVSDVFEVFESSEVHEVRVRRPVRARPVAPGIGRPRRLRTRGGRAVALVLGVVVIAVAMACSSDDSSIAAGPAGTGEARPAQTAPLPTSEPPGSAPGTVAPTVSSTAIVPATTTASTATTRRPTTTAVAAPTTAAPATSSSPAPQQAPPAPVAAAPERNRAVASTTVDLVDSSRPTISKGRTIASTRTLTTTVTYPVGGGPYPLIVFAHGFQLGPSNYHQIMNAIAAGGYVVAAPSFPLADASVAGANLDRGDIPNQSGDLSFVITQLSGAAGASGELAGKIDASRVGAVGHSDGADTVLDLGYYPGRNDPRVRAIAALSPDAMTGPGGSVGSAPLLLSHGDHDSIVPYANAKTVFAQVHAPRVFLTLINGDHLPPAQGAAPWAPVLDGAILDLLDQDVAGIGGSVADLVAHASVHGVVSVTQAG